MWSISEVKKTGMHYAKQNYWSCVLVGVILSTVAGGGFSFGFNFGNTSGNGSASFNSFFDNLNIPSAVVSGVVMAIISVALLVSAMAILAGIFAVNPLRAGCMEYMHRNLFSKPSLINIFNGFRVKYWSKVRTLFLTDLYIFLWSLLFIVPGIVKSYAYRMVPYIIAENPDISTDDALKLSSAMMEGHKGAAFGYDLSFIGWAFITVISFGLVGIFYYFPYKNSADAVLYERIKHEYLAKTTTNI